MTAQMREPLSLKLLAVLGVTAALYFAKVILMPLAMAVLLTFVLAPPVRIFGSSPTSSTTQSRATREFLSLAKGHAWARARRSRRAETCGH